MRTSAIRSARARRDLLVRTRREEGEEAIVAMSVSPGRRVLVAFETRALAAWKRRRVERATSWEWRRTRK